MLKRSLTFLIARGKEPSTWAGIAAILTLAHVAHAEDIAAQLHVGFGAAASLLAIFIPEYA